jgi:hypothetical protein
MLSMASSSVLYLSLAKMPQAVPSVIRGCCAVFPESPVFWCVSGLRYVDALENAIISLSATLSAIKGVLVLRHEMGPLLHIVTHMNSHPIELARLVPSFDFITAKLASLQP